MEVHRSAREHGIDDADIVQAAGGFLVAYRIDDDAPARELRLGFDTRGRLLETSSCFSTTAPSWLSTP